MHSIVLFLLILTLSSFCGAVMPISDLSQGLPKSVQSERLPISSFKSVTAYKLKNPKLLWVNVQLLKEMGFAISDTPTSDEKKMLLDSLAWVSKDKHLNLEDVTAEQKIFYSDSFGGVGIGENTGNARAANAGYIQIKGFGITPHHVSDDPDKNGRAALHEGIKDAVWGEVLSKVLPFGANRIIAIIDRGTFDSHGEPEILEIRVEPVRLGNFVVRSQGSDQEDKLRVAEALTHFEKAFPLPAEINAQEMPRGKRTLLRLKEFADRIGSQYGAMRVLKLYHGATSHSNMLVDGAMIDFGTASAQPGNNKIFFLDGVAKSNAVQSEVSRYIFKDLLKMLNFPQEILQECEAELAQSTSGKVFNVADYIDQKFVAAFDRVQRKFALKLLGIPKTIMTQVTVDKSRLSQLLIEVISADEKTAFALNLHTEKPLTSQPLGDLNRLILKVVNLPVLNLQSVREIVSSETKISEDHKSELAELLFQIYQQAINHSLDTTELKERVRLSNKPFEQLYLPEFRVKVKQLTAKHKQGADVDFFKVIDEMTTLPKPRTSTSMAAISCAKAAQ